MTAHRVFSLRLLALAVLTLAIATPRLWAQDQIVLGDSAQDFHFAEAGASALQLTFDSCSAGACVVSGSAYGTGVFASSDGHYALTTSASNQIELEVSGSDSGSVYAVSETGPITFSYASPEGSLSGAVTLSSLTQGLNSTTGNLTGELEITGGSLASKLLSTDASVNILVPLGGSLADALSGGADVAGQVGYPSVLTLAPETEDACGACRDFVTGGGWLLDANGAKANFGIHGGIRNHGFWGHVEFNDHGSAPPMTVKSTSITNYVVLSSSAREIDGTAEVNGRGGYTFKVVVADNDSGGEGPGPNYADTFSITVSNGYSASGNLGGGDIEIHNGQCESQLITDDSGEASKHHHEKQ